MVRSLVICTLIFSALLAAGCENRYRYACQNPDNWDQDYCKKPKCEISRDCPEHIFKEQAGLATFEKPKSGSSGDCKCNK
ncbi:hypothetical protein EBR43_10280 [bacterium]|nr:hypothetical protein [bacterium]